MKKEKRLPQVATASNDDLFLALISAKCDARAKERQLMLAETKLHLMEASCKEERRAAQKALDGMVGFISVMSGLVVTCVCVLAAPVWTAVLPMAGTAAVMRKAGWI